MDRLKLVLVTIVLALLYLAILEPFARMFFRSGLLPTAWLYSSAGPSVAMVLLQSLVTVLAAGLLVVAATVLDARIRPAFALVAAIPAAAPHLAAIVGASQAGGVALVYPVTMLLLVAGTPPLLFWLSNKRFQPTGMLPR